mgnify:CR=1 FL=1
MLELTQYAIREKSSLAREQYAAYTEMVMGALEFGAQATGARWLVPLPTGARWLVPLPTVARLLITLTDGLTITWLVDRDDALAEQVVAAAAQAVAALAAESGTAGC